LSRYCTFNSRLIRLYVNRASRLVFTRATAILFHVPGMLILLT
jgi:hypothetical protein